MSYVHQPTLPFQPGVLQLTPDAAQTQCRPAGEGSVPTSRVSCKQVPRLPTLCQLHIQGSHEPLGFDKPTQECCRTETLLSVLLTMYHKGYTQTHRPRGAQLGVQKNPERKSSVPVGPPSTTNPEAPEPPVEESASSSPGHDGSHLWPTASELILQTQLLPGGWGWVGRSRP